MSHYLFVKEHSFPFLFNAFFRNSVNITIFHSPYGIYLSPRVHLYSEMVCDTKSIPLHRFLPGVLLFRKHAYEGGHISVMILQLPGMYVG